MFAVLFYISLKLNFVPSFDVVFATANEFYINSFARISPYFPGVAGGWLYTIYNGKSPMSMVKIFEIMTRINRIMYKDHLFFVYRKLCG
jgi:hypothetical protein